MKNIITITKREYFTQVKKKSFIILTLLMPLLLIAFWALVAFMFNANKTKSIIQVVDNSGIFKNQVKSNDNVAYHFIGQASDKDIKNQLETSEELRGILIIPKYSGSQDIEALEKNTILWINEKIGLDTKNKISEDLKSVIQKEKIKAIGLNQEQIDNIDKKFDLKIENINPETTADTDLAYGVKTTLGLFLMYIVFMFIIMYGVRVMRSVLEEKNNRVVEIIISSVKPFELMMGKIIGVTLVALTQFTIWIAMTVAGAIFFNSGFDMLHSTGSSPIVTENMDIKQYATEISHILLDLNVMGIILVFNIFFLLGYLFYSSIYAAIGAAVDNETETQQFTFLCILPLMLGMYGSLSLVNNPDGPMLFWLSIIPFTSPVAMVARIPYGVPFWEILLSFSLLLGTTLMMIFIAGKIYRIGILMHGNKVTIKEILKWIKE